jgi:predicted DNA binding CopG/RHH family protein
MSKKLPVFKSDKEAEDFLDQDLSDYISAENFAPFQFEFKPKQKSVNLRISEELLNAVRAAAHRRGIPYQRYIRQTLEAALPSSTTPRSGKRKVRRSGK